MERSSLTHPPNSPQANQHKLSCPVPDLAYYIRPLLTYPSTSTLFADLVTAYPFLLRECFPMLNVLYRTPSITQDSANTVLAAPPFIYPRRRVWVILRSFKLVWQHDGSVDRDGQTAVATTYHDKAKNEL